MTDESLWQSLRAGSEPAFEALYRRYFQVLFSYGKRIHPDEDTVKQVIKAAKGIDISNTVLLMPIPKQEIDNNPDIEITDQNLGY